MNNDYTTNIIIPAFPDPIDEKGNALFYFDTTIKKYIVDPDYMDALIQYGYDVEAAAQALYLK